MASRKRQVNIWRGKQATDTQETQQTSSVKRGAHAAHAAPKAASKNRLGGFVSSIIGAVLSLVALVALIVYGLSGGLSASPIAIMALAVLLVLLAAAFILRRHIPKSAIRVLGIIRPIVVICAIPVGFLLLQVPLGGELSSIEPFSLAINLVLLAVVFVIIYFIGQRTRGSVEIFLAICLLLGLADYFLVIFKGSPLTPADLLAVSTAAEVSSGYDFILSDAPVWAIAIFVAYFIVLILMPKVRITKWRVIICTAIAVVLAVCFGIYVSNVNIEKAFDHNIDIWDLTTSYENDGTAYCFLVLFQDTFPGPPSGYSDQAAEELLAQASDQQDETSPITDTGDLAVIVVMNETFSDLSSYPGLENTEAKLQAFYDIAADSLEYGTAYVSVLGGGTCNSEFEFLTSATMGFLGHVYPYSMYDLSNTPNLARYFSDYGFSTHAIHPAAASNWNRDTIYEQMGFDDFADETYFEDADTFRTVVSDKATYDYVLDLLAEDEGSQFIFDVTLQNHGGYTWGGIDEEDMVHVTLPDGTEDDELNEYLACIKHSDAELAYFADKLNELDRPVVLCFFGDHQPSISATLYETTHNGESPTSSDDNQEAWQSEHEVPYLIWANAAAQGKDTPTEKYEDALQEKSSEADTNAESHTTQTKSDITSLNYLGSRMLTYLPYSMTPYQRFVVGVSKSVPAMNYFGYLLPDGIWHTFDEETSATDTLNDLAIVQYYDLFDQPM